MNLRRWYAPTVLALVAGGGLMVFVSSRTWLSATVVADGLPSDDVAVSGSTAQPVIPALGLVVAAAGLGVLATRGRVRQAVGAITVLVSLGVLLELVLGDGARESAIGSAIAESTAFTGANVPDTATEVVWLAVVGVAAVVGLVFGGLTVVAARAWPAMSGRFDAPGSADEHRQVDARDADGADLWKALDEGHDPTA